MKTDRILILGNSITKHGPAPDIGWTADCGMAASEVEKDYAHLFLQALAGTTGRQPEARILNIASFEREFETFDIAATLKEEIAFKADLVIVAIGENVPALVDADAQTRFKARLLALLAAVKSRPDATVLVRSSFWADKVKDGIMKEACAATGGCFVDISKLGQDESNYARAELAFSHAGVAAHPGDKGMRAIADALLDACLPGRRARLHPAPGEEIPSADYTVTVNGHAVFAHQARVSAHPLNQVWPGYQRPLEQTELAAFVSWDMDGPVEVQVVCARPIREVRVRPTSRGIQPTVEGNTVCFTVERPGQYTVEVNGTHHALHLFADPAETNVPDPKDPGVRYFGPGVHCPGVIRLESHQTVYLAGGAVVYGAILAEHAQHIAIRGRGILDGSKFDRQALNGLITCFDCSNVTMEGVTLRDPSGWTVVPVACRQVHIRHLKIVGNWRYNSDGIDFVNCQHCSVEDSFIRSYDDSIVFKGYENWGPFIYEIQILNGKFDGSFTVDGVNSVSFAELQQRFGCYPCHASPVTDIQVRRCVVWNEWGRALEIGAETVASEMSDLLFEDCDIIHTAHIAMDIQNCDRALCKNVVFKDIRVELDDDTTVPVYQGRQGQSYSVPPGSQHLPALIVLEITKGYCTCDEQRGHIQDIHFKDITVTAPSTPPSRLQGYDAEHLVQNVTIENLRLNGQSVRDLKAGGFAQNEFVRAVSITGEHQS